MGRLWEGHFRIKYLLSNVLTVLNFPLRRHAFAKLAELAKNIFCYLSMVPNNIYNKYSRAVQTLALS